MRQLSGILDEQRRLAEIGRIRIGHRVPTGKNKTRPEKLSEFRFTSASQPLLERVAERYGGEVQPWTPEGQTGQQWEVYSTVNRVPILVPPKPVSQSLELWSGGGCLRRCDGLTEELTGKPCLCGADLDPRDRECGLYTRLSVMLRDVAGIGRWRLESHGFNAAIELPGLAEFLAHAPGYIPADLFLVARTSKRDGKTHHFMVPRIEAEIEPGAILAGRGTIAPPAIESAPSYALGPGPARELTGPVVQDPDSFLAAIATVTDIDQLRDVWTDARDAGALTPPLLDALHARAAELGPATPAKSDAADAEADDPDVLWAQVLSTVPGTWSTGQVEDDFESVTGAAVANAGTAPMRQYLEHLKKQ